MKKWLSVLILTLCLLLGLAVQAGAADGTYLPYEGASYQLYYRENGDGTVTITGSTATAFTAKGQLVLPDAIDGKPVTAIGEEAFQSLSGFTGPLTLPQGLTSIGDAAFYYCTGLTGTLTLPQGLEEIGDAAFYHCAGFTGELTIPDSVTALGWRAFFECSGFDGALTLGKGLTALSDEVFQDCTGFTSVTLSQGLTEIGNYAFSGCNGLTGGLTIPDSVTVLGSRAFSDCSGFDGALTLGKGLTAIGDYAFSDCSGFTSVALPEDLISIGKYAFSGCDGLTGPLTLPRSLTEIGDAAFQSCDGFSGALTLPEGLTKIGSSAFSYCDGFTGALVLPQGLTEVSASAFSRCSGFTSLTLPQGLQTIGRYAFQDCTGLTGALTLPQGLTEIGYYAFSGCAGLTGALTLPQGLTTLGEYAFFDCSGFTSLALSDTLSVIGDDAFSGCDSLTGPLTLPQSLQEIGESAFYGLSGLTGDLTIPDSVTSIGKNAFYNCSGFNGTLTLGGSLRAIGDSAFSGCDGLTGDLVIPASVTSIGTRAFAYCSGFTGDLTIFGPVSSIGQYTFYRCTGFTGSLTLPQGLQEIGSYAFENCSGLTGSLVLPRSLTRIDSYAFKSCSGLTGSLVLPDSVTYLGSQAFYGCDGFDGTLSLPSRMTYLGSSAFSGCYGFTGDLTLPGCLSSIPYSAFNGCYGFDGTLTIPDSVTSVGDSAFSGCSGLTGLILGRGLTTIGESAFSGCDGLTSLTLPDTVTSLGTSAFFSCDWLVSLTLGRGIITVPERCFLNCTELDEIFLPDTVTSIGDKAFHTDNRTISVDIFYRGSEEDWAAVEVDLTQNNMLYYNPISFGSGPATPPEEDEQRLGTVESVGEGTVTIDGQAYPLAQGLTAGAWAGKYVLYTLNESGAVSSVTVLLRSTGILDEWVDRLSPDPSTPADALVTLSGVQYTFSGLGDRDFLLYEDLLTGQRVVFYRDSAYTVYRIEADPDSLITRVGYVTGLSGEGVTIGYHTFSPESGLHVPEDVVSRFVKYQVRGLSTLVSLELLQSSIGTLNSWDSGTRTLTISEKEFPLSPLATTEEEDLLLMVGHGVRYVHDSDGTVYQVDWAAPAPGEFQEDVYRAELLLDPSNDAAKTVRSYLEEETPCEILLEAMEQTGFRGGALAWEGVTLVGDSASDITNLKDVSFTSKDLFTAILLGMLEQRSFEGLDTSAAKTVTKVTGTINDWLKIGYGTVDMKLSAMSDPMLNQLAKTIPNSFFAQDPLLQGVDGINKVFSKVSISLKAYDTVEDCVEAVYNNLNLYLLSESMKDVLREMYDQALCGDYPLELQLALMDCMDIINATSDSIFVTETGQDVGYRLGGGSLEILLSEFWKDARRTVEMSYPAVFVLRAAYSGSKLLSNALMGTDEIVDQYWEVLATVQTEQLLESARDALEQQFRRTGSPEDARAFLSATDALFAARQLDCDSATKYVDAADSGLISKLMALAGVTHQEFKDDIESIRKSYKTGADIAAWGWLEYAMAEFPNEDLSEQYRKLLELQKIIKAACPVDVYVYDSQDNLVAAVVDERILCADANVTVVKEGESKTLYLYGDTDYRIRLEGYDAGTMDVSVTEYDGGAAVRTASFYDVALTEGAAYEADVSGGPHEAPAYTLTHSGGTIAADVDTQTAPALVEASVVNGAFPSGSTAVTSVTGAAGQEFTVTALVLPGQVFDGWTATGGTFADPHSITTTFRMPADGPVTLTANLSQGQAPASSLTLDHTQWVARPGEQLTLTARTEPAGAGVVWESMDPQVATVDQSGRVTALRPGTALILAATADGAQRAGCSVTVRDYGAVTLTLLNAQGQETTSIPQGPFAVRATVENGTLAGSDRCILACYSAQGQLLSLTEDYTVEVLSDDATARLTFQADNSQGYVAQVKLFLLSPQQGTRPLAAAGALTL